MNKKTEIRPTGQRANGPTGKRIAQSSIETTVALVVFFMLFVVAVKVFAFFTGRLVLRQQAYELTRVKALSGPRLGATTVSNLPPNSVKNDMVIPNEVMWDEPATKTLHIFK